MLRSRWKCPKENSLFIGSSFFSEGFFTLGSKFLGLLLLECKTVLLTVRHVQNQMWNRIVATNGYWKTLSPVFIISDNNCINVQSNLSKTTTLGTPKKWPLYRGGRSVEGFQSKLVWPQLTGGHYSEVAVNTGLTVIIFLSCVMSVSDLGP